ncbi:hypothetical protein DB44_FE00010, partial [Candidatus Protochlamydia amoebophila]
FCFSTFIAEETTNIQNIHVLSQHTFYLFCLFVFKTYFKAILFFDCFFNFCKLTEFLSTDNKKEEKKYSLSVVLLEPVNAIYPIQLYLAFRFAYRLYGPTAYERIFFFKIEISHLQTCHGNFRFLKKCRKSYKTRTAKQIIE